MCAIGFILSGSAKMHDKLLFFPPSLPNESLISRISRYHIMSGNRTEQSTFIELFDRTGFNLGGVVPSHLAVLAARLPGEPDESLAKIIQDNTLLPVFRPFLGKSDKSPTTRGMSSNADITHFPRHVVGMSGEAKLCLSCAVEDVQMHGVGYWHRSHQIPGVSVCWKHKESLIRSCQNCRFPFQRTNRLLSVPWVVCRCLEPLRNFTDNNDIDPLELAYATFAHELLLENMPPFHPDILMNTYREKIRQRGFIRGSLPALKEFQESMIDSLGPTFISKVDPAFSANRKLTWLRFSYIESALDMPITRHLMLGMHLFGTANKFNSHVRELANEDDTVERKKGKKSEPAKNVLRDEFRRKISVELKRDPAISMERLWAKQYRTVAWLFDNDKAWLASAVEGNTTTPSRTKSDDEMDREYARVAQDYSRKLFEDGGKPQRVSIGKILAGLTKKIDTAARSRERYPILFATLDLCKETSWCFSARRILWALGELDRIDETITLGNIVLRSSVGFRAVEDIMRFCEWDGEKLSKTKINSQSLLAKAGITRTWRGPSESKLGTFSGRGYVSRKTRIHD